MSIFTRYTRHIWPLRFSRVSLPCSRIRVFLASLFSSVMGLLYPIGAIHLPLKEARVFLRFLIKSVLRYNCAAFDPSKRRRWCAILFFH